MDAREQLRRFLEQRREAGETELVFDSLSVDDAMRILGAAPPEARGQRPQATGKPEVVASERSVPTNAGDWRAVLKEAGAEPAPAAGPGARYSIPVPTAPPADSVGPRPHVPDPPGA